MKLFTFHETCPGHDIEAELRLLTLWREHWTALGFEPVVLNEWIARQHPFFADYEREIRKLPSVNSESYELACWFRWLALAQVGGGWCMDYDVFTTRPTSLPEGSNDKLQLMQTNCICPCLFHASKETIERLCLEFASGQWGRRMMGERPHYSDQYAIVDMVEKGCDWITQDNRLLGYGDVDWGKADFVHFSNSSMQPRGMIPRWKHIPVLLKGLS